MARQEGNMNTMTEPQVRLFASAQSWIEGEAVRQLYATAKLDGVRLAVGFPDLHPGKGTPVGAAFVTEGMIYPHLIGGDIGCGMALVQDGPRPPRRRSSIAGPSCSSTSNIPGIEFVSDFLAEHGLESTEFDSSLGTIGGGNHFAELQAVEKVLDADAFKKLGLGKQQLVVLVHSGSRGLGESILRAHVDQHFGERRGGGFVRGAGISPRPRLRGALGQGQSRTHRAPFRRGARCGSGMPLGRLPQQHHSSREAMGKSVWLHRKGAVAAEGGFVVIPGSRGSLSYLVKPIGDGESHAWSLAHGAGRKWARSEARLRMRERFGVHALRRRRWAAASSAKSATCSTKKRPPHTKTLRQ